MNVPVQIANIHRDDFFGEDRGVYGAGDYIVIFGSDGYASDPRSRNLVQLLREQFATLKWSQPEFAVDDHGGETWVLIYKFSRVSARKRDALVLKAEALLDSARKTALEVPAGLRSRVNG